MLGRPLVPLLVPLVVASLLWGLASLSEPKHYDSDPQACQMEMIRRTFRANLLPWEDQPAMVQERLRQLQAAMTLDTLRDCQAKGLLTPQQVGSLVQELGLQTTAGNRPAAPDLSQPPARP